MYAGDEHVNEGSGGDVYEGHAFKNIHIYIIQTSGLICVCLMDHAGLFSVLGKHEHWRKEVCDKKTKQKKHRLFHEHWKPKMVL